MKKSISRNSRGIRKKILDIVIPKNFNLEEKTDKFKKQYYKFSTIFLTNLLQRRDVCIFETPLFITVKIDDNKDDRIFLSLSSLYKYFPKETTIQADELIINFINYNHHNFYNNCSHEYIIFPVWTDYYTGLDNTSSHASCVIINISKRKGFYYNPGIGPIEEEKNVCKKLEKLIAYSYYGTPSESNKIHISPLFIPESPQDITKDRNCLFWTFLFIDTFVYFLLNGYNYSPEHVVKLLLEKYNTKEKLLKLIDQFKYYLLESNI
jgi:hypothetical protein